MHSRILFLIAIFTTAAFSQIPPIEPGVSQDLAKWRAAHYSDVRYKLNLTLEKMSPVLKGTIEIHVNVHAGSEPGAIATGLSVPIILDWRKIRGHENSSTISNIFINGKAAKNPVAIAPGSDSEHLVFSDGVIAGENVIKLDFTSPILTSGSAITRYIDKEDGSEYLYSLFVPSDASTAFPVFDQPDLKARFTLTVHPPPDWNVVSNSHPDPIGIAHRINLDGKSERIYTHSFEETKPISTYVFAFAAGPFHRFVADYKESVDTLMAKGTDNYTGLYSPVLDPNKTKIYVRKSQVKKFEPHAAETFRLTREAVKYLETYFDSKFPFPKYDIVLIPEFPFGGMEHAGATFLREASVIFPTEPTKSDNISRATLIFHETAHQWFGDTVTMKWFDDLWLKEGFANFMAYKALEKIMPEANAWKVFYERIKQPAYATDSTRGTTPIYQEIKNLSAAKSAYGNIVYNKAPSFLRQAEFYLGEVKFQTAVRAFLKKHEYANAGWEDLVKELESSTGKSLNAWAQQWVLQKGLPIIRIHRKDVTGYCIDSSAWPMKIRTRQLIVSGDLEWNDELFVENSSEKSQNPVGKIQRLNSNQFCREQIFDLAEPIIDFINYQDYGYGIFLLDDKSRSNILKSVQKVDDNFLRSMMYGALWDSVREAELDPKDFVELVVKNIGSETDETIIQSLLSRTQTAINYYISLPPAVGPNDIRSRLEEILIERIQNAPTLGQKITFYRAFLNIAATPRARDILKQILRNTDTPAGVPAVRRNAGTPAGSSGNAGTPAGPAQRNPNSDADQVKTEAVPLKTKDKFDIVTRLLILDDKDAPALLAALEKSETSDDAKRYAYAAKAGISTAANKAKYFFDFVNNKEMSESWIEAAFGPFNSIRHSDMTIQFLERALKELPNQKRNRKIFFVNGWLGAFIGGQKSEAALAIVNKFLNDNPSLDKDLRLKILENIDIIERAVKIRAKF